MKDIFDSFFPKIFRQRVGSWLMLLSALLLVSCTEQPAKKQEKPCEGYENYEGIKYTGKTMANIDYHHGTLTPAVGVHNIQVVRANRQMPEESDGFGWTYNHAPNMAYFKGRFYLHYLSDSVGEHIPPAHTLLVTSEDGYNWGKPQVIFPKYKVPDGTTKEGVEGIAKDLIAVMHQRMGFYQSSNGRFLTLGYYGISLNLHDSPNDGKGIGRVVREIHADGSFGPVYFIRYNSGWNAGNTSYPFFESSNDEGFVKACKELLGNPLMMQQWNEEADRDDPLIPIHKQYKAFNYYTLSDGRIVGLWKHALCAVSNDGGKTWLYSPLRAPGFVNGNAKIWGQKTSDGCYATVYNPSEFRWPLAVSVSQDGLNYENLLLVNGEITTMRYGGNFKSYGPQYIRGILEVNGTPPDGNMWLTYSMNKEDIWVARVAVPVQSSVSDDINEVFKEMPKGKEMDRWNIYSPCWARVEMQNVDGERALALYDKDPFDYALAERVVPESGKLLIDFTVVPAQNDHGQLDIELKNDQGLGAIRLTFDNNGVLKVKKGYRYSGILNYKAGKSYNIQIKTDVENRFYQLYINGEEKGRGYIVYRPVHTIKRVTFRTGDIRRFPNPDTPTDQSYDIDNAGSMDKEAAFYIESFKTQML
jgi:hypothetical protein